MTMNASEFYGEVAERRNRAAESQKYTYLVRNASFVGGIALAVATERGVFSWFYGGLVTVDALILAASSHGFGRKYNRILSRYDSELERMPSPLSEDSEADVDSVPDGFVQIDDEVTSCEAIVETEDS